MGSTSLRSAASRSSFLLTRRRPQPKQPQHMFGWLSKKPLGCDLTVSASWPLMQQVVVGERTKCSCLISRPYAQTRRLRAGMGSPHPVTVAELSRSRNCYGRLASTTSAWAWLIAGDTGRAPREPCRINARRECQNEEGPNRGPCVVEVVLPHPLPPP